MTVSANTGIPEGYTPSVHSSVHSSVTDYSQPEPRVIPPQPLPQPVVEPEIVSKDEHLAEILFGIFVVIALLVFGIFLGITIQDNRSLQSQLKSCQQFVR